MLHFLLGRAGSGKTEEIYDRLCKTDGKALMFVPDQFVFEAERIIAEKTDEKTENIKICGFSALSEEILRRFCKRKNYADQTSKYIIMQNTVNELKKSLKYYSTAANRKGFASLSLCAVDEMKRAGISPDALSSAAEDLKGNLKDKVSEIGLIYSLYNKKLKSIYDDREDNLLLAATAAAENEYFKDLTVFIDGFDSFSGSQLKFLAPVIGQSKDCYVALTLDKDRPEELNFATADSTMQQLKKIADNSNTSTTCSILQANARYKSDDLLHLRNILSGDKADKYEGEAKDVFCKMSNSTDKETDYVFAEIKKLTRMGYRYNDINILCPSPAKYIDSITSSALRYNVPIFADIPSPISRKPFIKYLILLLTTACDSCGKNVLRLIKSGFARTKGENGKTRTISLKEINELQSYCDKWDIGHLNFEKPFSHIETETEKRLDDLRDNVVTPLLRFKKECEGKTGSEITELFSKYLFEDADIKAAIQGKCQDNNTRDLKYNKELTEEYNQLWTVLRNMLESAHTAMQECTYTLNEYAEIFRNCTELISLSKPPQVIDSVLFGDTHRTRSKGAKVVFVIGADENSFPDCNTDSEGIFTLQEYSELADHNLDLFADGDRRYTAELSACYNALTLPSERLYITYCGNKDQMGEAVETVTQTFDIKMSANGIADLKADFFCESIRSAEKQLAMHLFDEDKGDDIRTALYSCGDSSYLNLIDSAMKNTTPDSNLHNIDSDRAKLIFSFKELSPTAIKSLNSCRFSYFCSYGLGIKSPSTKKLDPRNIGNIVHFVMDYCFKKFYDGSDSNKEQSDDAIRAAIDEAMTSYREKELMEEQYHTVRFNILYKNLREICFYLLKYMTMELVKSNFRPSYFELDLKRGVTDASGFTAKPFSISVDVDGKTEEISLYGTVDRVDIATIAGQCENGEALTEEKHIRVIDYKTGHEAFGLGHVYYGMSLQLLLYLFALAQSNPDYIPSSATYYPSGDACIQKELSNPDDKKLRDLWLKNHPEEGVVVKDTAGDAERANYQSLCTDKKGNYSDYFKAETVSKEKFLKLKEHITDTIASNVKAVKQGDVSAHPLCEKDKTISCTFCRYAPVCGARKEHNRDIKSEEATAFAKDITTTETAGENDE